MNSRPFKAKYAGQCGVCGHFWEVGEQIVRLGKPVKVTGWTDFGSRKGETYTKKAKYAHPGCAEERDDN